MQIHEITRRRTDEDIVSGIKNVAGGVKSLGNKIASSSVGQAVGRGVKQAGAIGGAVVNNLTNKVLSAASMPGVDLVSAAYGNTGVPGQVQNKASEISDALIAPTAKAAVAQWQKALAAWGAEIGTMDPKDPKWQSVAKSKEETLDQIINQKLLRGRDYKGLVQSFANVPAMTKPAQTAVTDIDNFKNAILQTKNFDTSELLKDFSGLVKGAFTAQNLIQTMGGGGGRQQATLQAATMSNQIQTGLGVSRDVADNLAAAFSQVPQDKMKNIAPMLQKLLPQTQAAE